MKLNEIAPLQNKNKKDGSGSPPDLPPDNNKSEWVKETVKIIMTEGIRWLIKSIGG